MPKSEYTLLAERLFELRDELVNLSCTLHDLNFNLASSETAHESEVLTGIIERLNSAIEKGKKST